MKHLPCSVHRSELGCGSCKTLNLWHLPLILFTVGKETSMWFYGIRDFPPTYRVILGELRDGSWTGHSGFWSFPGSRAPQSPCSPWAVHSVAVTLCVVLVCPMWRVAIAQQPPVSTVWLPGEGGSPDVEILLRVLFSCVRLCAFIAKVHYWVKSTQWCLPEVLRPSFLNLYPSFQRDWLGGSLLMGKYTCFSGNFRKDCVKTIETLRLASLVRAWCWSHQGCGFNSYVCHSLGLDDPGESLSTQNILWCTFFFPPLKSILLGYLGLCSGKHLNVEMIFLGFL